MVAKAKGAGVVVALAASLTVMGGAAPAGAQSAQGDGWLVKSGTFSPAVGAGSGSGDAVTYDRELVPEGADIAVVERTTGKRTYLLLGVRGLKADREYGAHIHTKPCGDDGDAAGPHYQDEADPVTPSVDPAYANPRNEVWLDFATDGEGAAHAFAAQDWRFRKGGAMSLVLHEEKTHTGHGEAGMAGDRLACFTVPFA
ncbi:superoxide dismutase family protein [Streptomyces sp. A7024]|uniref:Superoxide dismutase family protein n=1 Tax=Streptomyces coryli TaxID=1128680 RepID=A0A6G4UCI6_9ACTN|nr:superoxide dismutase family protein [Streptomyces coryli]NGN69047.1 superoxide dismutase family protein [Streptomyces coryli]